MNLNAENFHRLCPALEKGTIYLPKMQQFSWVTEMHLGEGSKKNPNEQTNSGGGRRNNGFGNSCIWIQIKEKITAVFLTVEKGLPSACENLIDGGNPLFTVRAVLNYDVASLDTLWLRSWNDL